MLTLFLKNQNIKKNIKIKNQNKKQNGQKVKVQNNRNKRPK
jgi:hypothetical protein